ncbi:MAG TPA: TenA family transcriptional regulator [Gemmatimonadota bacterium]|nr:TenA family transcriptional regulator [Gemmatimonadota bacterium]
MGTSADLLTRVGPLWDEMLRHPFLIETRDGALPDATFARWMRQDYLFVEAAIRFMGILLARAPARHRKSLAEAISALHGELDLFREGAAANGVDLDGVEPSFVCHAYVQFLLATGALAPYAEGFTLLYVAEKAYHDSWKVVKAGIDPGSPWIGFVEKWAGEPFAGWVAWLETELDGLGREAGEAERARMAEVFETTVRYEIAFWELAYGRADGWPGIGEPEGRGVPPATG